MKKFLKKTALFLGCALLLSACKFGGDPSEKLPYYTSSSSSSSSSSSASYSSTTAPITTSADISSETGEPVSQGAEPLDNMRGTKISLDGDKLTIQRLDIGSLTQAEEDGIWTIFVYMCACDLESVDGSATEDLLEMSEATKKCSDLRFVVHAAGTESWNNYSCEDDMQQRLVISNGSIEVLDVKKAENMGRSETLADFLEWGLENYSSQYMALDFWDHGGGSITGVCFDELFDDDSLSLVEIDKALASVSGKMTHKFELIGCDACLMGSAEMANIFAPYAKYMVCSQNLESGYGWNYVSFGETIGSGSLSGDKVGKALCDSYYKACIYSGEQNDVTLSVIDLSKIDGLITAFDECSRVVYEYCKENDVSDVIKAAKTVLNFGGNNNVEGYTNMLDLKGLIDALADRVDSAEANSALDKFEASFDECVIYKVNGYFFDDASGLSVYYPLSVQGSAELDTFKDICVSPYYLNIVDLCAYASASYGNTTGYDYDGWLGESSGFWNDNWHWDFDYSDNYWDGISNDGDLNFDFSNTALKFEIEPYTDEDGYYCFKLTENSLYILDTVYCNIMMSYWDEDDGREYMLDLGTDDYVDMNWQTGECSDNFSGYWFALPDGQPLCAYLIDAYYDDYEYYNLYSAPVYLNDEYTYLQIKQTYLTNSMTTEILGVWDGISESGGVSRNLYQLEKGDVIEPCYPAYDYETGEYVCDYYGEKYIYNGLSLTDEELLYEGDYYYAFEIYDIYGNVLYTDFVMLGVGEDGSIYYYDY